MQRSKQQDLSFECFTKEQVRQRGRDGERGRKRKNGKGERKKRGKMKGKKKETEKGTEEEIYTTRRPQGCTLLNN